MIYKNRLELELDDWLDPSLGCGQDFSKEYPNEITSHEFTDHNPAFRHTSAACPYASVQLSACRKHVIFNPNPEIAQGNLSYYANTCPTPLNEYMPAE
jgi:hypothetical protein